MLLNIIICYSYRSRWRVFYPTTVDSRCSLNLQNTDLQCWGDTRCDQNVPGLIFLLGCGYTSGHPCFQGGVLELPLSLGQGMVPAHLSVLCELRSKRIVLLLVPQKEWRLSVVTNMLQEAESNENFMGQIITGDETWVYGYEWRRNVSLRSGSLLIPRGQRKRARYGQK